MKKIPIFIVLLFVSPTLLSCSENEWKGFVYPNKHDLTVHKEIGAYESLESCRVAALRMLTIVSSIDKGDYECGLNCGYRPNIGDIQVCEKTEQ